jgi:hypothetical protein
MNKKTRRVTAKHRKNRARIKDKVKALVAMKKAPARKK